MALALGSAYVTTMWPIDPPPQWVDRSQELATLRVGVEALRHGGGAAVWVEGEPGIGKSSLVVEALAGAGEPRWDIGWGMADQLAERLPLSVMRDCLQVRLGSPDPRRAHAAELLRSQRLGLFADGDASVSSCEVLIALADELCAAAPTVMVIDDLQWADDASLLVWHQLAASIDHLRLLLLATCRSDPRRPEVQQVRASLARRGGAVVALGPLPGTDVAALVTAILGTPSGDTLRQLTAQAAGNPLYLRELVDALARERAPQASPPAGVSTAQEQLPTSLAAVLLPRCRSYRIVVRGSACEAASCTSRSGTPASRAAVMNACLSVWGVTALVIPARRAVLRTVRPAPCRSSRRPSGARNTGPSVRSPMAKSIARAVRGASGMVTTLPPFRVMVRVR